MDSSDIAVIFPPKISIRTSDFSLVAKRTGLRDQQKSIWVSNGWDCKIGI